MPIKIPDTLPAKKVLEGENIFVMDENRAIHQDIRPLKIAILNLMPKKIETETQLLRLLSNTPLQVDIELVQMSSHQSKNTSKEHLLQFYKTFDEVKNQKFDGLIITGAPVELLEFEDVDYWAELCEIMEWSKSNVFSTLHICWGAQAGLHYHYGIAKHNLPEKLSGVYKHRCLIPNHPLMRGADDIFLCPHSRYTTVYQKDIDACENLDVVSISNDAGVYIVTSRDNRQIFLTGHPEYDVGTLASEYFRDVNKGLEIKIPAKYFPNDNPDNAPQHQWRSHANLIFSNWLNYFLYQSTPYDLSTLKPLEI